MKLKLICGSYSDCIGYCKTHSKSEPFIFKLAYADDNMPFKELNRFVWESRHRYTRFKNRYSGNAVIDMSDWTNERANDKLYAFLYFLKDREELISCVFISENECGRSFCEAVERLFDFERVNLPSMIKNATRAKRIGFTGTSDGEDDCGEDHRTVQTEI